MTEKQHYLVFHEDSNELKSKDLSPGHSTKMARLKFLVGLNGDEHDPDSRLDNSRIELNTGEKIIATRVVVNDDEVLYQNNVEAALNSLSKICAPNGGGPSTHLNCPVAIENNIIDDHSSEKIRRRHSSSVEITAMTSVKTGVDGVPVISFSFLQADEKGQSTDNIDKDTRETSDLYDFPKNSRPTSVYNLGDSGVGINEVKDEPTTVEGQNSLVKEVDLPSLDSLYDFPKTRPLPPNPADLTINPETIKQIITNEVTQLSVEEDCVYDVPHSKDHLEVINKNQLTNLDDQKHSFTSLSLELDSGNGDTNLGQRESYSDPDCPSDNQLNQEKRRRHRLGKAWGKMRTWLREEKVKLGEVVQRHARMQAVGALHNSATSEEDSPSGSRCGSYDLVAARARELGSLTHVEEFGLASVSEEINDNTCVSHDLETRKTPVCRSDDDNADVKVQELDKKSPENTRGRLRKKMIAGSESNLSGTKLKLTPVSFSLDKLCDDVDRDVNEKEKDSLKPVDGRELKAHVGKGGLIKRRMLGSIRGLMASTHLLQQHDIDEVYLNSPKIYFIYLLNISKTIRDTKKKLQVENLITGGIINLCAYLISHKVCDNVK